MEVANCLNFSRAAERLCITQPAVSHQINTLENELGVKLFQRTSKSVRLTQEGFLFTQYAGEILKLSGLSKARVKDSQQKGAMRLVIGCRNSTELSLLRPALRRLRELYPDVLPVLRLIPFDSLENLLTEGDIHMIFSFKEAAASKAHYQELAKCPVVCICSTTHPLADCKFVTTTQLQDAGRIAVCRPPICPPPLFALQSRMVGERKADQILFCDNQEVIFPLVEAGYAFSLIADFPHARIPGIRYVPLPEFELLSFGAVYLPGKTSPVVKKFLAILKDCMQTVHPMSMEERCGTGTENLSKEG